MDRLYERTIKSLIDLRSQKLHVRSDDVTPEIRFSFPYMFFDLRLREHDSLISHKKFEKLIEFF